jgi:preprotein translocase subunit SecD
MNGNPAIAFFLTKDGAETFSRATGQHIGQRLAIVLNNTLVSAPVVQSRIEGEGIIQEHLTVQQA